MPKNPYMTPNAPAKPKKKKKKPAKPRRGGRLFGGGKNQETQLAVLENE